MGKTPNRKGSFTKRSPWAKLRKETQQEPELRRPIIRELEKLLGAQVVTYFASFSKWTSQVSDDHAEMLENLLATEYDTSNRKKLVVVVNSPGGQALAAERIVNVCRSYSGEQFEALVPHMAKSAATMICFGANAIHMSRTSELGPVDPQVVYDSGGEETWISAAEYVRAYERLMDEAASGQVKRIEPHLQQLARFDARYIEKLRSHQELSEDISVRLLKAHMMRGKTDAAIKKKIAPFLLQSKKSSHGRMISASEANACGLNVKEMPLSSPLWEKVWELYVRADWVVAHQAAVLIESRSSTLLRS